MALGIDKNTRSLTISYTIHKRQELQVLLLNNWTTGNKKSLTSPQSWGIFADLWYPVLVRQQSDILQYPVYQLNLKHKAKSWKLPALFLAGTEDRLTYLTETYELYEQCPAPQKDLLLIRDAGHGELATKAGEMYFNDISTFLNTVMPRRQKPSNRKRLALIDDRPGNHRPDTRDRTH